MLGFWIGLPLELRLVLVALAGLLGGALANHIIYRFAFHPRPISPWGKQAESASPRRWIDYIPVLGWWSMRRDAEVHGRGFWIRPLLIEVATALGLVLLYQFEIQQGGLLAEELRVPRLLALYQSPAQAMFLAHAVLVVLMIAATFIDFDERTIPDVITIPGTLLALVAGAASLNVFLPTSVPMGRFANAIYPTTFDSPWYVPGEWMGAQGLWVGLAIWTGWCFALSDRRWSPVIVRRRGLARAVRHFFNGLFHYGFWKVLLGLWLIGFGLIWWVWQSDPAAWLGLFTSLVGLAVGGGVIWAIRIVATWSLQMEAMGFGDVTLMAMIGAIVGWQASLIAFFLSPFAAIAIVLLRFIITRDPYTPYGPYLCGGTLLTILGWNQLYNGWLGINLLMMGSFLLWLALAMLGLMAAMLFVWRHIKLWLWR